MNDFRLGFSIFVMLSVYLVHIFVTRSNRNRFSKILSEITLTATISAVSYCFYIMFSNYFLAFLSITVYCIAIDWLVYFVFVYVLMLTEAGKFFRSLRIPFKIVFIIDSLDLVANWSELHRFHLEEETSAEAIKQYYGVSTSWNMVFSLLSYSLTLITILLLIYYIRRANFFARKKYLWVFSGYLVVLAVNLYCVIMRTQIDYSIVIYFIGGIALYYGTTEVFPKQLMRDANQLLLRNINMVVMFFDLSGYCVYANSKAELFLNMQKGIDYKKANHTFKELYAWADCIAEQNLKQFVQSVGNGGVMVNSVVKPQRKQGNALMKNRRSEQIHTGAAFFSKSECEELDWETYKWDCHENVPFTHQIQVDGTNRWVRYYIWNLKNKKRRSLGRCLVLEDITEEAKKKAEEAYNADHDFLTGLLNREAFLRFGRAFIMNKFAADGAQMMSYHLISVNIRNFKRINVNFTTKEGDILLQQTAHAINACVNEGSNQRTGLTDQELLGATPNFYNEGALIGRMGADRFAFILNTNKDEKEIIKKISEEVLKSFNKYNYRLEIVFGISPVTIGSADRNWELNLFYDNAIKATQSILPGDEKNYAYYDDALMQKVEDETRLVDAFETALKDHQFVVFVQPQYDTHEMTQGGEALVRWNHPDKGLLPPGAFLEPLKSAGLMHLLDLYVWEEVVKLLRKWSDEGKGNYYLSANIDPADFYHMDVFKVITELTDRYGVDRKCLKLEITEAAMKDDQEAKRVFDTLEQLRLAGYTIELDDFGSEYSSLNRLKDIPADVLKMDMKFLAKTGNEQNRRAITDSIIYLGNRLNMTVIAEGVEEKEQFEELANVGCQQFQGYYFSKPVPVDDFEKLMV